MGNLIIKGKGGAGNKVIIQDQGAVTRLQTDDAGITITAPTVADMTNCTFPAGHITNVFKFKITDGTEYSTSGTAEIIAFDAVSFSATSGRHYVVISNIGYVAPARESGTVTTTWQESRLYYGTTNRSQGGTSVDTLLDNARIGHYHDSTSGSTNLYQNWTGVGHFTAGSTATHYVYVAMIPESNNIKARMGATTTYPWNTIIYEVTP